LSLGGPSLRPDTGPKSDFVKKGQWVFLVIMLGLMALTYYIIRDKI